MNNSVEVEAVKRATRRKEISQRERQFVQDMNDDDTHTLNAVQQPAVYCFKAVFEFRASIQVSIFEEFFDFGSETFGSVSMSDIIHASMSSHPLHIDRFMILPAVQAISFQFSKNEFLEFSFRFSDVQ
jgi:hypothetical protein